jgi:hypothetical protein
MSQRNQNSYAKEFGQSMNPMPLPRAGEVFRRTILTALRAIRNASSTYFVTCRTLVVLWITYASRKRPAQNVVSQLTEAGGLERAVADVTDFGLRTSESISATYHLCSDLPKSEASQ